VTPSSEVLEAICEQRVLAIVRLETAAAAVAACGVLGDAGVGAVEISLTQPDALAAVSGAVADLDGRTFVGAGTVRTVADATAAADAGAQFLVAPNLDEGVAAWATERDLLYLPGALTPTEVETATRLSPLVKLFPAGRFGPGYVRDLRAPLPDVALVPTGGVDAGNAVAFLESGAVAVAVGSALVNATSVAAPDDLAAAARNLLQLVAPATPTTRRP
jgi:2-dehydro-3-deoxyphosphogluconate aldolase/(4S)-4-hydroxy-2-oxoglutarate aldolase